MLLQDVVRASTAVAASRGRLDKIARLAALLGHTPPGELDLVVAYLSGTLPQGRIGVGAAALRSARDVAPAPVSTLSVTDVDRTCARLAATSGGGSVVARAAQLRELFGRATRDEQDFLVRLLFGELRQGALESLLVEAVARAASLPVASVRRAVMLAGALPAVARAVLTGGETALGAFTLHVMQPIQPMLADTAAGVVEALGAGDPMAVEDKLDGARIQVHKLDEAVRVFSRALNDVTAAVPEVVEAVRRLPARTVILDGEAIALRPDRSPYPFQITMRRFGRRLDVDRLRMSLPIAPFFFDCLYLDGTSLIDEPLARRVAALDQLVPPHVQVQRQSVTSAAEAEAFAARALAAGHEGVMVKSWHAPYAAGRRGGAWLKVKPARTLDLVVVAAEWGSGRRRGWLSNLHVAARDTERGGFVMLGKTFKGLTDEMLRWQTARLLTLELGRDEGAVYVRPELVAEIAFNDVQQSPHYPGGLALRFARVKRYRDDKGAADADTLQALQALYRQTTGLDAPGR